jgi:alpha-glucosidase (family GH31 glycosyl hydrolase)
MASMGDYFVKNDKNLIARKDNVILGKTYRISILTDRLVRLEYSPSGVFEDRATQNVIFRNFPKVTFTISNSETLTQISTSYFTIDYVKEKSFKSSKLTPGSNLRITLKDTDRVWYYGHPESRNFGTIGYSLDNFSSKLKLDKGLYSTDGFAVLDDSNSYVLKNSMEFVEREKDILDIYVFMYKKDLGLCLQDYYTLCGYPPLIPRYALGNWWYKNEEYTTKDVYDVVKNFYDDGIGLSVFLLGDKWQKDNSYIFNNEVINGIEVSNFLKNNNIKFGVTVDPFKGINDKSIIPFNMDNINLYFNQYVRNLYGMGINIFNLDYNNPNDKNNLALLNHYHYVAGETMLNQRGITMCRNTGISMHRYPIIFSGKTKVDFNTLNILPFYNASASNMGISFIAHPIGGYYGGIEDDELYLRYVQFGTFSPIFLLSSEGGKYYKREPWRWNESLREITKKYMNLRMQLIPYLYTESYIYHKSGSPLIQPLYYSYPKIYDEPRYRNQYFLGTEMLVIPITKTKNTVMNRVVQKMFIPKGTWYDFLTGRKYPGNKYYMSFYKDEDYPVFCREGSIIPLSLDMSWTNPINMEFVIFPGCDGVYNLYEDDGISNDYKNEVHYLTKLEFKYEKDNYVYKMMPVDTQYSIPNNRNYRIRFKNTGNSNVNVSVNGVSYPVQSYLDKSDLVVVINNVATSATIIVNVSGNDIEVEAVKLINYDIKGIIDDLEIETIIKEKVDDIIFSNMTIKKKRIAIRKLKKYKLEPKFINMFLNLLEYIDTV